MSRMQRVLSSLDPRSLANTSVMIARNLRAHCGPEFKSRPQQLLEVLQLSLRKQFYPEEYFLYGFAQKSKDYPAMLKYLSNAHYVHRLRRTFNDPRWVLLADNKWLFHLHYSRMNVPVTRVLGYYERSDGCGIDGRPLRTKDDLWRLLREVQPKSLVAKPVAGFRGFGLLVVKALQCSATRIGGVLLDGRTVSFEDIAAHVDHDHGVRFTGTPGYVLDYPGYLIEECLEDHPFFAEINPYTATTLRIVTYCSKEGEVEIDFALARFGRKGLHAANWDRGGVAAGIDPQTGRMGPGMVKPRYGGGWHITHPDSQVPFAGRTVPMWNEIIEACARAARTSPGMRSLGWDVILTPTGPRIIEVNPDWGLPIVQLHTEGHLTPRVRARLAEHGISFPERKLPPLQVGGLLMLLRYGHDGNQLRPVTNQVCPPELRAPTPDTDSSPVERGYAVGQS
jgi:hypothetical protein